MPPGQDQTKIVAPPGLETKEIQVEQQKTEAQSGTKTDLQSLRSSVEVSSASSDAASTLLSAPSEAPVAHSNLDPKRNITRTIDYTAPADWFNPVTNPQNYPKDYFEQKKYDGQIPKRFEDSISLEELTKMRNEGSYIEKMSYSNSVEYYKQIMGGIPPNSEWITSGTFLGNKVRTNIVLAIALKELEFRLKSLPGGKTMRPNFHTLTSYNPGKEKHHGLAMAIDFDPRENWLAKPSETKWNIPLAMTIEAQKLGFDWGMYYFEGRPKGDTDAMHFAYRGRIPTLMKSLKSPEAIAMAKNFKIPGSNNNLYDFDDTNYLQLTEGGGSRGNIDTKNLEEEEKVISKIADKYNLQIEQIKENPEKIRSILAEVDILEIRSNANILFKTLYPNESASEDQIIESETARRITAYTQGKATDFGWFTLNYKQVNETHEMQVGLGEILLDPSIQEIEVIRGGIKIKGKRGIKQGRVCFIDDNGAYIASYTGDKFRITSKEALEKEAYAMALKSENQTREAYPSYFENQSKNEGQYTQSSQETGNLDGAISILNPETSPISNKNVIDKINSFNPAVSGEEIIKHAELACQKYKINIHIVKALIKAESAFNWQAVNKTTKATGFGQFLIPAWTDFLRYCKSLPKAEAEKLKKEWQITSFDDEKEGLLRNNPKMNIYATIWYMEKYAGKVVDKTKPIQDQAIIFALYHHDGPGGGKQYLRFLNDMRAKGCKTRSQMREEYIKNPEKYSYLVNFQKNRGIDEHLKFYFDYACGIAINAAGADIDSIQRAKENMKNNPYDGELDQDKIRTSERIDPGTVNIPYRFAKLNEFLSNGGSIGFTEGSKQKIFNPSIAESQLIFLASQGFKEIISLVHREDIDRIIRTKNIGIRVINEIPGKYDTSIMSPGNEQIINKIANNLNGNIKTYVHCRHGAHRAIISTTLAMIKAKKTDNLETAFDLAKGNLNAFYNSNYSKILEDAVSYAKRFNTKGTEKFEKKILELKNS